MLSVSKGNMDNCNVWQREGACCLILSHGLLQVIEKSTVCIHYSVYKIFPLALELVFWSQQYHGHGRLHRSCSVLWYLVGALTMRHRFSAGNVNSLVGDTNWIQCRFGYLGLESRLSASPSRFICWPLGSWLTF